MCINARRTTSSGRSMHNRMSKWQQVIGDHDLESESEVYKRGKDEGVMQEIRE